MMKSKRFKVLLVVAIILVLSTLALIFSIPFVQFNKFLKSLEQQGEMPCYVTGNIVYDGDLTINLKDAVKQEYNIVSNKIQVMVKSNDLYYFVFTYFDDSKIIWNIASCDKALNVSLHYKGEFGLGDKEEYKYYYDICVTDDVDSQRRNGFYYDGCIYLTDFEKAVIYDIDKNTVNEMNYKDFIYPEMRQIDIVENLSIVVKEPNGDIIRKISLAELSKLNTEISKIYKMRNFESKYDSYSLDMFYRSVRLDGDKVYIFGDVRDSVDNSFLNAIEYNYVNNTIRYLGFIETSHQDTYIVFQNN